MPISLEIGDIFATPAVSAFAHGCNCAGAMGKGIAVYFRQRWPMMYEEYRRCCKTGTFKLGDVFVWEENNEVVFNLATQQSWTTKAELWAVEKSLCRMIEEAETRSVNEIVLPRIGAGLGGLIWPSVLTIFEKLGAETPIKLRVCDIYIAEQPLTPSLLQNQ